MMTRAHPLPAAIEHTAPGALTPQTTADAIARLEHEHRLARTPQLARSHEAGEARADDDGVHHQSLPVFPCETRGIAAADPREPTWATSCPTPEGQSRAEGGKMARAMTVKTADPSPSSLPTALRPLPQGDGAEEALARRAAAGDTGAFDALVTLFGGRVFAVAF